MKDGIIRPDHVVGKPRDHPDTLAYQNEIGAVDLRLLRRRARRARGASGATTSLSRFLDAEVDGHRLTREDILDICFLFFIAGLDTVSASLDCFFGYLCEHPEQRRAARRRPGAGAVGGGGAAAVGDAGRRHHAGSPPRTPSSSGARSARATW